MGIDGLSSTLAFRAPYFTIYLFHSSLGEEHVALNP